MPRLGKIVFHSAIAIILTAIGIYVLVEKKLTLIGRYSLHKYQFESPAYFIMASAFFLAALVFILGLFKSELIKKINQKLFTAAFLAFIVALFM